MAATAEKAGHVARETKSAFGALANETRLSILCLLAERDMNVSELADALNVGQTVVSHSLRILSSAGFVNVRQQGHFRYHSLNKEFADPFLRTIGFGAEVDRTQHLTEIFEHAPLTLSAIDKDGTYTFLSGGILTKFGFKEEDFLGKNAFVVNQHVPATVENLRKALTGKTTNWASVSGEMTFNITAIPRRDRSGEITGVLSIAMEMPRVDHKVRDEAATEAWKALAQGTPDIILRINQNGVILAANHDFRGAKRDELIGVALKACLPDLCHTSLSAAIATAFAERSALTLTFEVCPTTGYSYECRIFPDGEGPYAATLVIRDLGTGTAPK